MKGVGFTPKLRLAPVWPALAAVLTGTLLLALLLPSLFERSTSLQLLDTLEVLTTVVAERLDAPSASPASPALPPPNSRIGPGGQDGDVRAWLHRIAGGSDLRLTLIAADGTVIADGAAEGPLANHLDRSEVRQALADGSGTAVRTSTTTGRTYVYAARTFTGPGGRLYVLRLAQPVEQLHDLRGPLATAVILALLAAGVALLLVSLWIDRRLLGPLSQLIVGAGELASGRYSYRLEVPDEEELADLALALNRLAATVEGQFAAVNKERDHLKAILAGMSEGVLVVGRDGRAQFANPAFYAIFGLQGEIAGRQVLEIVRQPDLAQLVDDTLAGSRGQSAEIAARQGGGRKSLQLVSAALSDGGAVVVARDTTEFTRLTEMRRDFVANVSHELKTPLAAIRGYAETLRDGAAAEPQTAARFLDRILFQCRRLQLLLDDLLTLSRLESLDEAPPREPVDLADLAAHAADLVSAAAREKKVEVRVEVRIATPARGEAELPPVTGDPDGLERMLVNLLDNAIKYNRPGGTVTVRLRRR
ncbi:MAG TPA: histidine kinase dimerization/phospho-acceptor domain-containing protein, partial [Thermoanaerobaculia bacterium]|nr:histidine kinase dimerization/phospho-acceptor domain-containing protein [Thermoanaerobaculia bacterium]